MSSSRTRQPRLRASCDGCFGAKVKCSKVKPICDRCLSIGNDCTYSVSVRAGRAGQPRANSNCSSQLATPEQTPPTAIETNTAYQGQSPASLHEPFMSHNWATPHPSGNNGGMFGELNDTAMTYTLDWPGITETDMLSLGQTQFMPDVPATTNMPSSQHVAVCSCLNVCLWSLQTLQQKSLNPSATFDDILQVNHHAIEGCESMLNCSRCMAPSVIHMNLMIDATVMGKVMSMYKTASAARFGNNAVSLTPLSNPLPQSNPAGMVFGNSPIQLDDLSMVQLEFLNRDFGKLHEVYWRFREICVTRLEEPEFNMALVEYLERSLTSAIAASP